jgi:hypothetical protein
LDLDIYPSQLRIKGIIKKESVELLVYLTIGIWRGPRTNKQYPTLEQYIEDDIATQVMSVCIDYPCILEIVRFPVKDKSETLSSLKCYPVKDATKI